MRSVSRKSPRSGWGVADHLPPVGSKIGILAITAVFIFVLLQPGFSQHLNNFKPGSEPEGWGNITWGTNLKAIGNMEYNRKDPSYGGIDVYRKKENESEISIWGVKVKNLEFSFWKEKFCGVCFYEKDYSGFEYFKDAISKEFGAGKKAFPNQEYHLWEGKKTLMSLEYKPNERSILFMMLSTLILSQMEGKDRE